MQGYRASILRFNDDASPVFETDGLLVVGPVLGHASWHAYRDLTDASNLTQRDSAAPAVTGGGAP